MINEELFIKVLKKHYQSHKTDMEKALEDFVLFGECRIPVEGIEIPSMDKAELDKHKEQWLKHKRKDK